MVRLHLLGFTHDLKGIVFSERRGGKTATFWVPVDDALLQAVEKLVGARRERDAAARRPETGLEPVEAGVAPSERTLFPAIGRSESRIPASEIQQLLREGRNVDTVAKAAKASRAWVERLAEPVMVERAGVVRLAQRAFMPRPRLGRSGLPLGQAIQLNLEERRATSGTLESLDDGWDARATRSGPWRVRLRFTHRGERRVAEWDFVKSTQQITPRNRLGADLGWWPPPEEPKRPRGPETDDKEDEGAEAPPRKAAEAKKPPVKKPKRGSTTRRAVGSKRGSGRRRPGARRRTAGR